MADVDELNDAGAADGEKDLVADFLMREQDKLAGLEDDFGMSNIRSPPHNVASVYRRFSCSIQQSSCYTCYTEDRGSMKISRRNPCSPFFSVSYSINRHKII